jgi:DNA-binding GntR family transcriptional regulator
VCGEYRHEEPLTQESVARRFSVSTMPAREALLALAREGMVYSQPNRGFRVARMDRQAVEDIYWMHSVVAGRMAARACLRQAGDLLAELEQTNSDLGAALDANDIEKVRALNAEFHEAIGFAADSPRLAVMMITTVSQIPRHFYSSLPGWGGFSYDDHRRLIQAFRRRSPGKAQAIATKHVETEGRLMVEYLDSRGFWAERPGA